jgi:plastocyanin
MTPVASIRPMPKRLLLVVAALALLATACVSTSTPPIDYGQGQRFVPFVVDSQDDVGQGSSIALTSNNEPYVSYFGFPGKLAEGQIAVPRPFGAPTVPFVGLATASTDGLWQRGAVVMQKPVQTQSGVNIPFGPVIEDKLDLKQENSNGTSVALAEDGTVHVAWTMGGAVYLASTKLGGTSAVTKVYDSGQSVSQAGPVGRPGITLDANGDAWVAFTAEGSAGREVHVISPSGSKQTDTVVARLQNCNSCGAPQATGIGVVADQPLVVYVDAAAGGLGAATFSAGAWKASSVTGTTAGSGSAPQGLAVATDGNGAFASYYAGDGSVQLASLSGDAWKTTKVSDATPPTGSSSGNLAPTTAVSLDDQGTVYVAWVDNDGLRLSSGTDTFAPVNIGHPTATAAGPSLASSGSGVALSWYDTDQQNLMAGFFGDLQGLVVAQPSPSLTLSQAPSPAGETCGKGGGVVLDVVAKGLAFDPTCLVAAPGSFTITMDNQDTSITHNIDVYDEKGGKSLGKTDGVPGPAKESLDLTLDEGTYYFVCDYHPTTMFGDLVVQAGAK